MEIYIFDTKARLMSLLNTLLRVPLNFWKDMSTCEKDAIVSKIMDYTEVVGEQGFCI